MEKMLINFNIDLRFFCFCLVVLCLKYTKKSSQIGICSCQLWYTIMCFNPKVYMGVLTIGVPKRNDMYLSIEKIALDFCLFILL
jgi:hypothetical protein